MTLPPLQQEASAVTPTTHTGSAPQGPQPNQPRPAQNHAATNTTVDQVAINTTVKANDNQIGLIRQHQDEVNAVAASFNKVSSALEKVGLKVDAMKSQLTAIVKNYPPFPAGER